MSRRYDRRGGSLCSTKHKLLADCDRKPGFFYYFFVRPLISLYPGKFICRRLDAEIVERFLHYKEMMKRWDANDKSKLFELIKVEFFVSYLKNMSTS